MALTRLSEVLWRERQLLETLLFKLEEEQLLLAGGRTRWLAQATREVEVALDEIRETELLRALAADAAAEEVGCPPGSSLAVLAAHAAAPWDELLRAHRDAFTSLTSEIAGLADGNRELLALSHRATQETLASLHDEVRTYDGTGQAAGTGHLAHLIDRSI